MLDTSIKERLRAQIGKEVLVRLRNGEVYRGRLLEVDEYEGLHGECVIGNLLLYTNEGEVYILSKEIVYIVLRD
jgi:small nuclear ribonucleoprotein (snRNP)-like protein